MPGTPQDSDASRGLETNGRTLPVQDVLDILRLILRVEPLDILLQKVVDTIADAFGMERVSLGVMDDKTGLFCVKALHGFPPEKELAIKRHAYTLERMRNDLAPQFKIGRSCYYVRVEDQVVSYDDDSDYIVRTDLVDLKRESTSDWHELDYIDFLMTDRIGGWIGWIEIDEPSQRKVPTKEVIDKIHILSDLAAIAIENSRTYEEAVTSMTDAQGYLDLIVHDIGNMVTPLEYYIQAMKAGDSINGRSSEYLDNSLAVATSMRALVNNVKKFSEVRASESASKEKYDLREVLTECCARVRRDFPDKNIRVNLDCPVSVSSVMADDLIFDLFTNLLNNAVRYSPGGHAEIEVKLSEGHSVCTVRIADRGIGIPDSKKANIFQRFSKRPEGMTGTGLGLSIVSLLVERYGGIISAMDRVPGDYSQGTSFEVSFPKVMPEGPEPRAALYGIPSIQHDDGISEKLRKA